MVPENWKQQVNQIENRPHRRQKDNGKFISTLFLDIGGVLLSNGWGHEQRNRAIAHFHLDAEEINERHHLTFDTYEQGKLSLDDYLKRVIFYEKRSFSAQEFRQFMFDQSTEFGDVLDFFKIFKRQHHLRYVAVSNEGRELNHYRVHQFRLNELFDAFVSSSFVHLRKPDVDLFRMAIDIAQAEPDQILYIDDRKMFVEVARTLGLNGLHHQGLDETKKQLNAFNFTS
ncbi:MAG TPA: HAD family hydrolase [Saprospiraceae bacterium]|nr:HAD family hydrolase [Saprospiraceae bacterium]